jgi:cyclic nucleotide-binding protein
MRSEASVISLSWIPSEAVKGMTKVPFEMGMAHYDETPPDVLTNLEEMKQSDRFRFANELRAYIDVEDGRIVAHGHLGKGHIGSTRIRVGGKEMNFAAVPFADIRPEPEVRSDSVRFVQTAGGRTGVPAPRRVRRKPFVQLAAPTAWSTLALTIFADGRSEFEVLGASPFPRHWIYDNEGKLAAKSGLIDFKTWYRQAFGKHTPWGAEDSPALVTQVETALERELSTLIMRGDKRDIRKVPKGKTLVDQGDPGRELFLLLDGVLKVEIDGEPISEVGPGAILGELALLEGGTRTATLRAVTPCKVVAAGPDQVNTAALRQLAQGRVRKP